MGTLPTFGAVRRQTWPGFDTASIQFCEMSDTMGRRGRGWRCPTVTEYSEVTVVARNDFPTGGAVGCQTVPGSETMLRDKS